MNSEGTLVDQDMYYPAPISYGYYYTGSNAPGEWDGQRQFLNGQEVQYMSGRLKNFLYPYDYTPRYEILPYVFGAVGGSNVPLVYAIPPQYNGYVDVPIAPFYHNAVRPRNDKSVNVSFGNESDGSKPVSFGMKKTLSSASVPFTMVSTNHIDQYSMQPVNKLDQQLVVKSYTTKAGQSNAEGNITILLDQYNKVDFPVDYSNAKFFVIKSYSEDDVHKSVKYNVWSSTPSGNKKLDKAYEDAQGVAQKDHQECPVFLFFSVNGSGTFCGVAEMTGRVDFNKDMDFWQQDKWSGSFPVKWHFIKDVPNAKFRHITLENNENNPVSYSRDTQEIMHRPGMEILKIFEAHDSRASLLDDFLHYESREKFVHEERAWQPSMRFTAPLIIPALRLPPPRKLNYFVRAPATEYDSLINQKNQSNSKEDPKQSDPLQNETANGSKTECESNDDPVATLNFGSLTISTEKGKSTRVPSAMPTITEPEATITVGTMPVKINGLKKSLVSITLLSKPQDVREQKVDK